MERSEVLDQLPMKAVATIDSQSPTLTESIGAAIASVIEPGDVVLLVGELGAGKTTMTRGFAGQLGATVGVTSPTFAICHLYDSDPPIAHVDCWRLTAVDELDELALEELLDDGGVAILEWGALAAERFGAEALLVELQLPADATNTDVRSCVLSVSGTRWGNRADALRAALVDRGLGVSEASR